MEENQDASLPHFCPKCHTQVRETDYYCFNCGTNLQPAPPKTDLTALIFLYGRSIIFPPFGILFAFKYLNQSDQKYKIIGFIAIALTLVSFLISIKLLFDFMNQFNMQLNNALNSSYGF